MMKTNLLWFFAFLTIRVNLIQYLSAVVTIEDEWCEKFIIRFQMEKFHSLFFFKNIFN